MSAVGFVHGYRMAGGRSRPTIFDKFNAQYDAPRSDPVL
jgi:hypothetical protein